MGFIETGLQTQPARGIVQTNCRLLAGKRSLTMAIKAMIEGSYERR